MSHVSFSELKNWSKCAFYHKLVNIDKIKLFRGNEYVAFGTAIHDTCENMLLNENLDMNKFFLNRYKEELRKLKEDNHEFNKQLALDMRSQGLEIIPHVKPELEKYFGKYKVFSTEERLFEDI